MTEDNINDDPTVYYTDRTTATTDDKCGMRRWWYKHEAGIGIVPAYEPTALRVGKDTHEDLSGVGEMEDISPLAISDRLVYIQAASPQETQTQKEELYRRIGWLAAYALYIEPRTRADYSTISIEAEHILDRTPLWISYTPDRYLRHREGKYLVYKEYKSTISASNKWLSSWPFAIQIHIGLAGMSEELGEKVAFAQVMGLMKGDERWDASTGKHLAHPYVWGWKNSLTNEWTHDYTKARTAAWTRTPVWEFPGGVVEWVQACGPDVASAQFPHSQPVFLNSRLLDDWVIRRTYREMQLAEVAAECAADWSKRIIYFEPRYEQCRPPFGDACPYALACHNAAVRENPLACADYIRRTPHHEIEKQFLPLTEIR